MRGFFPSPLSSAATRIRPCLPVSFERNRAREERRFGSALMMCRSSTKLDADDENDVTQTRTPKPKDKSSDAYYAEAVSKAQACLSSAPAGQLLGRAGRRCTLEDAERHALRAVASRPSRAAEARLLLARSLVLQARGREIEVPRMVVEALRATEVGFLDVETAVALVEAAGVAFEKGAGVTTGFSSVELFVRAVCEAAAPESSSGKGIREAVAAAAAAVAARMAVAKERARREEEAVEKARRQ